MKKFFSFRTVGVLAMAVATASILFIVQSQGEESTSKNTTTTEAVTVQVQIVAPRTLSDTMLYSGTLQPASDIQLVSETQGQITRMPVDIGSVVPKGAIIAEVEKSLKEAAVTAAEATLRQMRRDADRLQALALEGNATENEVELARLRVIEAEFALKNHRRALEDAVIRAPFSGVIAEQFVRMGSTLAPSAPIVRLVDIASLRFVIAVQEHDIPLLRVGQQVMVTADVYPNRTFKASIIGIAPTANQSGTFNVTLSLPNSSSAPLKAGMTARTSFMRSSKPDIIAIAQKALTTVEGKEGVFIIQNGRAVPRQVQSGTSYGTFIEIHSGLNIGDSVVVQGVNRLRAGNEVRIVTK